MFIQRVFIPLAALLALCGCRKQEGGTAAASSAPPPVQIRLLRVEPRAFTASVAVTGTLVSRTSVEVKAQTTGRVLRFPKEEGERVAAGEALLWVDEENYKLALRQAESAVQVAEAALERARVLASHNEAEYERARNLLKSGGITDRDLKAAEIAERDSKAQVSLAAAQLEQARASVAMARKQMRDTVISAPVAGEIQRKYVNPGAYVEPPTPVFALVDNSRLELESPVAAAELAPIRPGQRVPFRVSSFPGRTFEGAVVEILPAVEAESRSAKVRIRVNNPGGLLKAGMFAEGEIVTGVNPRAIVLPASAVYRSDAAARSSYVFAVENGVARRRQVALGREKDGLLEIAGGLQAGDLVAAEQSIELADGVPVQAAGNGK
jgi:RND family efflux transporter MFP subunit